MKDNGKILSENCGVNEEIFPCMGKCCRKNEGVFTVSYEKTCPHCDITTSLPYGANLKIVTIFECVRLGYDKRVTE